MNLFNTLSLKDFAIMGLLTTMLLSGCASDPPVNPTLPKTTETEVYHYAEKGQTIHDIANLYGRDYQDIARWNNLSPPYKIYEHQKLLVSGPPATSTSPGFVLAEPIGVPSSGPLPSTPIRTPKKTSPSPKKSVPSASATPQPKLGLAPDPITLKRSGKVYHKVQRRETLYSIAKHYGQNYREVASWNGLSFPFDLVVGSELLVSPPFSASARQAKATAPVTSPKPRVAGKYVVQPQDTLYSIAKRSGYSMADIMAWNDLQSRDLTIGQTLIVGPPSSSTFVPTQASASANYHTVAPGDTLYSLARRYGYEVEQLVQWNDLSPSYPLSRGQRLRVSPPGKTSLGRSSKTSSLCHRVAPQETLYSISKNAGYAVADVAKWNDIPWPYTALKIGQNLQVAPDANCR